MDRVKKRPSRPRKQSRCVVPGGLSTSARVVHTSGMPRAIEQEREMGVIVGMRADFVFGHGRTQFPQREPANVALLAVVA